MHPVAANQGSRPLPLGAPRVVAGILKWLLNPGHPAPMLSLGTEANASGR